MPSDPKVCRHCGTEMIRQMGETGPWVCMACGGAPVAKRAAMPSERIEPCPVCGGEMLDMGRNVVHAGAPCYPTAEQHNTLARAARIGKRLIEMAERDGCITLDAEVWREQGPYSRARAWLTALEAQP